MVVFSSAQATLKNILSESFRKTLKLTVLSSDISIAYRTVTPVNLFWLTLWFLQNSYMTALTLLTYIAYHEPISQSNRRITEESDRAKQ